MIPPTTSNVSMDEMSIVNARRCFKMWRKHMEYIIRVRYSIVTVNIRIQTQYLQLYFDQWRRCLIEPMTPVPRVSASSSSRDEQGRSQCKCM